MKMEEGIDATSEVSDMQRIRNGFEFKKVTERLGKHISFSAKQLQKPTSHGKLKYINTKRKQMSEKKGLFVEKVILYIMCK